MSDAATPMRSHSQYGCDLKVVEYFGKSHAGTFLEAGANDPKSLSQTYLLESLGWSGALVEPVPECCEKLRRDRPRSRVFENALGGPDAAGLLRLKIPGGTTELASGMAADEIAAEGDRVIEAELITLTRVLELAGIQTLDLLSLDLEGMELDALEGLDFGRFPPKLIIIEDRMDDLRKHAFLKRRGYKIVLRNGSNHWYVPASRPYPVPLPMRWELFRRLYLSVPFRWLRSLSRKLRGKQR